MNGWEENREENLPPPGSSPGKTVSGTHFNPSFRRWDSKDNWASQTGEEWGWQVPWAPTTEATRVIPAGDPQEGPLIVTVLPPPPFEGSEIPQTVQNLGATIRNLKQRIHPHSGYW